MSTIREQDIKVITDEQDRGEYQQEFLTIRLPHPTGAEGLAHHICRWNIPNEYTEPDRRRRQERIDSITFIANTTRFALIAWLREIGAVR